MNFKNWQDYRDKSKSLNLYVKSHLKEMRLKPTKDAIPEKHKVYTGDRWKEFDFYKLEQTEPIRSRKPAKIRELEITTENICKSLYIINKSAKKSRDSKNSNYYKSHYGIVSRCKERQNNLYGLKNYVMNKLIKENKLSLEGYHIQAVPPDKTYLLLYRYKDYTFHVIADKAEIEDLNFLGNIDDKISAHAKNNGIKFNEATDLLNRYLGW